MMPYHVATILVAMTVKNRIMSILSVLVLGEKIANQIITKLFPKPIK